VEFLACIRRGDLIENEPGGMAYDRDAAQQAF
jgi:hypothetical protein